MTDTPSSKLLLITAVAAFLFTAGTFFAPSRVLAEEQCATYGVEVGQHCQNHYGDIYPPATDPQYQSCAQCAWSLCSSFIPNYQCMGYCVGAADAIGCT